MDVIFTLFNMEPLHPNFGYLRGKKGKLKILRPPPQACSLKIRIARLSSPDAIGLAEFCYLVFPKL